MGEVTIMRTEKKMVERSSLDINTGILYGEDVNI